MSEKNEFTESSKENLYKNIRHLRIRNGMSQSELAELAGYTDRSSIAKIEAGEVDLSLSKIRTFAKIFNVTASELIEEDMNENAGAFSIGKRIRELREKQGISQVDLAAIVGVSKQNLYKYEFGIVCNIPLQTIERLAAALHVSPAYLVGWEK